MSILVIDTFKTDLQEAERILKAAGLSGVRAIGTHHEAACALGLSGDVREALAVETIVIDISTGGEALAFFHALREHAFYRHVPVVMVAHADADERLRAAFAVGAEDFVRKPYAPSELVARVRRALRTHESLAHTLRRERELFELSEEMAQLKRLLTRVMLLDPQTALASRRCFEESLQAEWRRAQRSGKPLAIVAFGIDGFGRYNDQLGHQSGDVCLKRVARVAQSRLGRPGDVLARFGGGLFCALLPETGSDEALIVAENLRHAILKEGILYREAPTGEECVSISSGVASTSVLTVNAPAALIEHAEDALAEAKATGGNRIRVAPLSKPLRQKESA